MNSPFGVFRKHGRILTAGLTVLAIFAFIFLDSLKPEHVPILLGMIAFGAIFYLFGQPSGHGTGFAIAGATLGLIVMPFVGKLFGPPPAATTSMGNLSAKELTQKIADRNNANLFIYKVHQVGFGERPDARAQLAKMPGLAGNQQILNFLVGEEMRWDRRFGIYAFAPLRETGESQQLETVRTWVRVQEADKMGIRVSDQAITNYIQKASDGKLSREKFMEFRDDLNLSDAELYDILRYHLKAQQYFRLTMPASLATTPEENWRFYQRTTVSQDMELATIDVKDYVDQVPEPGDAEVIAFFDLYKNNGPPGRFNEQRAWEVPTEMLRVEPGFAVPRKVRIAYLTGKFPEDPVPTEEDLAEYYKKYYDTHKSEFPNLNPNRVRPLEIAMPALTEDAPAVAQKPRTDLQDKAWAEKPKYLTYDQVKDRMVKDLQIKSHVTRNWVDDQNQAASVALHDEKMTKAMARMTELSTKWRERDEGQDLGQEISDEVQKLADELGLQYTVPPHAWTPAELNSKAVNPIGHTVELEIHKGGVKDEGEGILPPGLMKATMKLPSKPVGYQAFEADPQALYQPWESINPEDKGTRYIYWKIEDHESYIPETWADLTTEEQDHVKAEWKMAKARELAKKRAEELLKIVKASEKKDDLKLALAGQKSVNGAEYAVHEATNITWLEETSPNSNEVQFGRVFIADQNQHAGEQFMKTAFEDLENPGDTAVLMNADGSKFFLGQLEKRQFGKESLTVLRESFTLPNPQPGHAVMNGLAQQEARNLYQTWQTQFDEKYQIQIPQPAEREN